MHCAFFFVVLPLSKRQLKRLAKLVIKMLKHLL